MKNRNREPTFEDILEDEHPWSVKDIGTNAISGFLNETQHDYSFMNKKTDSITTVPPTPLRKVRPVEFEPYLKSLADVIDKYQLNKVLGPASMEGIPQLGPIVDDLDAEIKNMDDSIARHLLHPQIKVINKTERARILAGSIPPKDSVPNVFSNKNFDLKDSNIFASVTDYKDIVGSASTDPLSNNKLLQEQLLHYLDTVEAHLLKEISRRSGSFFEALAHLKELHKEIEGCVDQIVELRSELNGVAETTAKKALEIVLLKKRRGNVATLYGATKIAGDLKNTPPVIKELLAQADYVGALDLLDEANAALRPDSKVDKHDHVQILANGITMVSVSSNIPKSLNLHSVKALEALKSNLAEMEDEIESVMKHEFVMLLDNDIRDQVERMMIQTSEKSKSRSNSISKAETPAMGWVRNILAEKYSSSPLSNASPVLNPTSNLVNNENFLRAQLEPLVTGLLRMDKFGVALEEYRRILCRQVKIMTNKLYPMNVSKVDGTLSTQEKQAIKSANQADLAKKLRSMTFDEFHSLLKKVFVTLLNLIQRAAIIHELIVEISKTAEERKLCIGIKAAPRSPVGGENLLTKRSRAGTRTLLRRGTMDEFEDLGSFDNLQTPPGKSSINIFSSDLNEKNVKISQQPHDGSSPTTFQQNIVDSSDSLFSAADLAHIRCAKLLAVRSEQNIKLPSAQFYKLFGCTWEFLSATESLCGRMCLPLKGALLAQAKLYIAAFHDEKCRNIAESIDNEQWVQVDIPIEYHNIIQDLQLSTPLKTVPVDDFEDVETKEEDEFELDLTSHAVVTSAKTVSTEELGNTPDAKKLKQIIIDDNKFYVVKSVLVFLTSLVEYVKCAESLSNIVTEILNRIFEILKIFNSRVCQVILGAGAMQSAGLKNISARHIALAAQSLGAIMAAIPYLRKGIAQFLAQKQLILLNDFDRIVGDFRDHQNELYLKLVGIMNDRLATHVTTLMAINWDNPETKDFSDGISVPISQLVKETVTLHKVLQKLLPAEALKSILIEIFRSYTKKLEDEFRKVDLFSSAGKNRLLIDVQYLISHLSSLDGIDGPGNHLEVCVNNIKIKDRRSIVSPKPPPPPLTSSLKTSPTKSNFGYNFGSILRNQQKEKDSSNH